MKKIIALGVVLASPLVTLAATYDGGTTVDSIFNKLIGWIYMVVPVLITIAVIYFVWGVIQFMTTSEEEAKKMGRTKIINGLIGLFVIVAFWGIIAIVKRTFGVGNATGQNITPCVPTETNHYGADC